MRIEENCDILVRNSAVPKATTTASGDGVGLEIDGVHARFFAYAIVTFPETYLPTIPTNPTWNQYVALAKLHCRRP